MNRFLGILACEYRMSIKRWGVWLAFLLSSIHVVLYFLPPTEMLAQNYSTSDLLRSAGQMAWMLNLFMPVVAGIAISDRLVRDRKLGVSELFSSTPLNQGTYILGKYAGAVLAVLTPMAAIFLAIASLVVVQSGRPDFYLMALQAMLAINLPAYLFISAFSLAVPMVLPLRVYQVLYTGYWYWGNYLNPSFFPSISDTVLNASGRFPMTAFFWKDYFGMETSLSTGSATTACLNWAALITCGAAALVALYIYLSAQKRQA